MQTTVEQPQVTKSEDEREYTFSVQVGAVSKTPDPFIPLGVGRVRYSRFNSVPKNTLYTLHAEKVFFGISRCNLKDDAPNKATGRTLALNRAVEAMQRHKYSSGHLSIDQDGHTGYCSPDMLPLVEKYFYDLDRLEYEDESDYWD